MRGGIPAPASNRVNERQWSEKTTIYLYMLTKLSNARLNYNITANKH